MADASLDSLITSGLNALAASPGGQMTVADFVTHIETRQGPTDAEAQDAQSEQSKAFLARIKNLVTLGGADSLIDRGYASLDATGGMIGITDEGRAYVGR